MLLDSHLKVKTNMNKIGVRPLSINWRILCLADKVSHKIKNWLNRSLSSINHLLSRRQIIPKKTNNCRLLQQSKIHLN